MTENREYSIAEAAPLVEMADKTLRDKCTRYEVPHHRRHRVKGIYFTQGDLEEINAAQVRRPGEPAAPAPAAPDAKRSSETDELDAALAQFSSSTRQRRVP